MLEVGQVRGVKSGVVAVVATVLACAAALLAPGIARADSNCVVTQDHSILGETPSAITFFNNSGIGVDIYWLNYPPPRDGGAEVYYFSLGDGVRQDQATWLTHPWKAIDPVTGACLGFTISDAPTKTYVVQPPSGPLNLSLPFVSGDLTVGQVLTAVQGTYDDTITSYAYQWQRCPDSPSTCVSIDGATGATYRAQPADVGRDLRVVETATSLFDKSTDAYSALVGYVAGAPEVPPAADLEVSLTCTTNCSPAPGENVVFTGAVKNLGPDMSIGASASITFGSTVGSYSFSVGGTSCDGSSCGTDDIAAGDSVPISFTATVSLDAPVPGTVNATLTASSDGTNDPNSDNNSVTASASIASTAVATNVTVSADSESAGPGARQIPTANIDLSAVPEAPGSTASAPIASIPIASIPIASIPIASIPIASIGLTPALLDIVGGVPLSSVPLHTAGGWDARLLGTPLAGAMLQVVTLADVFRQAPAVLTGLDLGDIGLASSPIASIPIASIALGGLHLSDLPLRANSGAQNLTDWCTALRSAGFACNASNLALADGTSVGTATMASIGIEGAPIASIPIASIPIASIPFASIPIASIPIASIPIASIAVAGSPIASIPIASIAVAGSPIASIPIASIPNMSSVVDCAGYACATKTLGEALADNRILETATLSDLGPAILQSITIAQLARFFPLDITLGDVLAILAGPPSARGYERLPFTELPAQDWASDGDSVVYHVNFGITGGPASGGATVKFTLPTGFRYAGQPQLIRSHWNGEGTTTTTSTPAAPAVVGDTLSFQLKTLVRGDTYDLAFRLGTSLILGNAGPGAATVTPDAGGTADSDSNGAVTVRDTAEGSEDGTPIVSADSVYLSYITSATDTDSYRIPAPPAGSHVTVKLVPPSGADYDLVLYRPSRASVVSSPIASIPLDGQPVPDTGVPVTHAASSQAPETLADIPIASLPIASISDNRGAAEEEATAVTQPGDDFLTIGVSGYQGSTSNKPYALLVTVTPPPDLGTCLPSPIVTSGAPLGQLVDPASTPAALNTLFVVDSRRLRAAYPSKAQDVLSSLSTLAGRADLGVTGAVLDVAQDPGVTGAQTAWDASPCLPANANAVARAVASVVARYTAARSGVKYVVLVGGDDQIPFFRLPDLTTVSNEVDYASTFIDRPNQYFGSLASGDVLSDNPYGTPAPTAFFDRFLYVPSRSVGRLVETADDIIRAVNQFVSSSGTLSPSTALVTGYDFLADGSKQIVTTETAQRGAANTRSLIDDPAVLAPPALPPLWSSSALDTALGVSPASVLSLNAHYDHYRLLPSDRGTLFSSSQMAAKSLAGRFVFTMGCHAGLSVSDIVVGGSDVRRLDWAQVYGAGGALYAAATGFGYGDTTGVAYSEKLMSFLAKRMDGTVTAGEAMMFAKNDFKGSLGPVDVYDEKVISETTFYGLPMYRVGPQVALPPTPAPRPTTPDASIGAGIVTADLSVTPTFQAKSSPFGSYFASDDIVTTNYRPVEPSTSADVTQATLVAHGALITQLASSDSTSPVDAAFSMPTIDRTATATEPVFRDAVFPTKIQTIETYTDPRGRRQRLVLAVGQFASDPSLASGRGRQRNFTQLGARVYYAPSSATDFTPAQFGLVEGAQLSSQAAFSVHVSDGGTGVKRVLVGYHDGNAWKFVDLQPSSSDLWTGGGPTTTANPEFFVQAVDGAGNVSVTSYKGRYYLAPPPPQQGGGLAWSFTGTPGANGWFKSTVTGTVTAPTGAGLNLDGGPFNLTSPLSVTGDGVHLVGIRFHDAVTNVPVGIDATLPTVTVSSPVNNAILTAGDSTTLRFACADAGSGVAACTATLNGSPVANGATISGTAGANSLVVTAEDAAGNRASKTVTFTVHWTFSGFFSPIDNLPTLNVIKPGQAVPVKFSLGGNRGLGIFATGYPAMETIQCASGAPLDPVESTITAGNSSLSYDSGSQQYNYVWKTPGSGWPSGACRQLIVKLVDGSSRTANFKAK